MTLAPINGANFGPITPSADPSIPEKPLQTRPAMTRRASAPPAPVAGQRELPLPPEVMDKVLTHLSGQDLRSLRAASRSMRTAVDSLSSLHTRKAEWVATQQDWSRSAPSLGMTWQPPQALEHVDVRNLTPEQYGELRAFSLPAVAQRLVGYGSAASQGARLARRCLLRNLPHLPDQHRQEVCHDLFFQRYRAEDPWDRDDVEAIAPHIGLLKHEHVQALLSRFEATALFDGADRMSLAMSAAFGDLTPLTQSRILDRLHSFTTEPLAVTVGNTGVHSRAGTALVQTIVNCARSFQILMPHLQDKLVQTLRSALPREGLASIVAYEALIPHTPAMSPRAHACMIDVHSSLSLSLDQQSWFEPRSIPAPLPCRAPTQR